MLVRRMQCQRATARSKVHPHCRRHPTRSGRCTPGGMPREAFSPRGVYTGPWGTHSSPHWGHCEASAPQQGAARGRFESKRPRRKGREQAAARDAEQVAIFPWLLGQWCQPPPPFTPPRSLLQPASGGLLFSAMPVMHGVFIRH